VFIWEKKKKGGSHSKNPPGGRFLQCEGRAQLLRKKTGELGQKTLGGQIMEKIKNKATQQKRLLLR